jgi:hypothetical protein
VCRQIPAKFAVVSTSREKATMTNFFTEVRPLYESGYILHLYALRPVVFPVYVLIF